MQKRAGLLVGFTGIDDPYEPPLNAEITLDTMASSEEENARLILDYLIAGGLVDAYIPAAFHAGR